MISSFPITTHCCSTLAGTAGEIAPILGGSAHLLNLLINDIFLPHNHPLLLNTGCTDRLVVQHRHTSNRLRGVAASLKPNTHRVANQGPREQATHQSNHDPNLRANTKSSEGNLSV